MDTFRWGCSALMVFEICQTDEWVASARIPSSTTLSTNITWSLITRTDNERTMHFEGTGVLPIARGDFHRASVCSWGELFRFSSVSFQFSLVSEWFRWRPRKFQAKQSLHSESADIRHAEFRRRRSYAAIIEATDENSLENQHIQATYVKEICSKPLSFHCRISRQSTNRTESSSQTYLVR